MHRIRFLVPVRKFVCPFVLGGVWHYSTFNEHNRRQALKTQLSISLLRFFAIRMTTLVRPTRQQHSNAQRTSTAQLTYTITHTHTACLIPPARWPCLPPVIQHYTGTFTSPHSISFTFLRDIESNGLQKSSGPELDRTGSMHGLD